MLSKVANSTDICNQEGGDKFMLSHHTNVCKVLQLCQHAKKVLSDSPGLVDFAIGPVNSVFNLPDRQVMFFEEIKKQKN